MNKSVILFFAILLAAALLIAGIVRTLQNQPDKEQSPDSVAEMEAEEEEEEPAVSEPGMTTAAQPETEETSPPSETSSPETLPQVTAETVNEPEQPPAPLDTAPTVAVVPAPVPPDVVPADVVPVDNEPVKSALSERSRRLMSVTESLQQEAKNAIQETGKEQIPPIPVPPPVSALVPDKTVTPKDTGIRAAQDKNRTQETAAVTAEIPNVVSNAAINVPLVYVYPFYPVYTIQVIPSIPVYPQYPQVKVYYPVYYPQIRPAYFGRTQLVYPNGVVIVF